MNEGGLDHLSRISTIWALLRDAHGEDTRAMAAAQSEVMARYSGAVHRYLQAVLRDGDAADEVFQEFALKFLRGGYRHADPQRGRFRDYVKTSILRLVADYRKRQLRHRGREKQGVLSNIEMVEPDEQLNREFDDAFTRSLAHELLGRAWTALEATESMSGQPHHTVLKLRSQQPELSSAELAAAVTERLGRNEPYTAAGVRKTLQRAREVFAHLLLYEVRQAVEDEERLEQEVIDLGLHPYCKSVLERKASED